SVVVSKQLNAVADFVRGDKHYELISGLTISDPMLFNSQKILHYSDTVEKEYQDTLYSLVSNQPGHFEFEYGRVRGEEKFLFFDYNDEPAYEDVDGLFQDLLIYHDLNVTAVGDGVLLTGLPASHGKASGKCRIVMSSEPDEWKNVEKGEVLVTNATSPDMTPAMAKAVAIVTDFGGVTCHAAIVCRELNLPCIVGTKTGTSILKNGMKVEVDAYKGTVSSAP
ncbi:MAG: PEP-utilizing enzyme, partial [Patescibacteria group bacterium]